MCVTASSTSLLEKLDVVLGESVDLRDFNVHAGLVNAAIAEGIAASGSANARKILLSGDLANEFLADYGEEQYRGATYYELPGMSQPALRDALVRLDSIGAIELIQFLERQSSQRSRRMTCSRPSSRRSTASP